MQALGTMAGRWSHAQEPKPQGSRELDGKAPVKLIAPRRRLVQTALPLPRDTPRQARRQQRGAGVPTRSRHETANPGQGGKKRAEKWLRPEPRGD